MITIDRLSLPIGYIPKVGDVLQIMEITGGGGSGRWCFKVSLANKAEKLPKQVLAWLISRLAEKDVAEFMLWYTVGKPLEKQGHK